MCLLPVVCLTSHQFVTLCKPITTFPVHLPYAQAGSRLTFWRSAPQRSTRNKRLYPYTRGARGFARLQCIYRRIGTQYLHIPTARHGGGGIPCNIAGTLAWIEEGGGTGGMSVRRRDRRERRGREDTKENRLFLDFSLASRERSSSGNEENVYLCWWDLWNDGILGRGFFPESHRAKETSCFDLFIVDATFSARTARCFGFWKMANLEMEADSNDTTSLSMILFSFFLFTMGLSFIYLSSNCALYKVLFIIIRRN